ncbi:MAG TPA: CDP-diacylglycerol--glycerol-3-phosphate 3-phosphatidyltransferase [Pirellulaceae bacterium]|nr:CDP-diacylglycerol--glycerol-3-phosphate 3-phosphatidyltransferase [Pirellulaceae bacterium]
MPSPTTQAAVFNLPNQLTALRLLLSIVVFVLIPLKMYVAALVVFLIAASTDWIDGWYARKYGQVTKLGRVFDPFVDKIIICGTFIFLAAEPQGEGWLPRAGIAPWMAVVVMGREMLVTALRSMIEGEGGDFSAKMAGKLKMVFQCMAAAASLLALKLLHDAPTAPLPLWLFWSLHVSVWLAIVTTIYSGLEYVIAASRYFKA